MATHQEMNHLSICEIRVEKMVSLESEKVAFRTARFLRPLAEKVCQAAGIPHIPLLCDVFPQHLQQWPSKVLFKGWRCPQKDWSRWVQELAVKHKRTWERSGIYDAILSSTHEVPCNLDVVLGLAEFWCPENSTFLFPWGEATITLEDMMILGGYSVSGKPVRGPPNGNLVKLVEEMDRQRREFCRSKAKKASHGEWLKRYMGANDEFEHVAFLSLWISRYVFPQLPDGIVGNYVFSIAALLSQGTRVALAPAVLASLYRDLTFLKKEAMSFSGSIAVAAPFQLLQLWTFERFPSLRPKAPNSRINLQLVKSAVKLKKIFLWRPYGVKELRSFTQCLQATELEGIDCKEMYQPQRVAMQFGFDQDIPGRINTHRYSLEHIPAKSFRPGVSARYLKWWEDTMSARQNAIREIVAREGSRMNNHKASSSAKPIGRSENLTAKQIRPKSAGKGSSSSAVHKKTRPSVTRERNDETDLLPIYMLAPKRSEDSSIFASKEASNSRHEYPPSLGAALTQKNLGKKIQGSESKDQGHNDIDNRGKLMKPQFSYPKKTTTTEQLIKPSCHSSKDVLPPKTLSSSITRKRKLSPTNSEDTSDTLDFLPLSHGIRRTKIIREQLKISPVKDVAVKGGDRPQANYTATVGNYVFDKPEFEERLQRLEKLVISSCEDRNRCLI